LSPNPASTGQTVTLTATVTASAGAAGNVSFFDGGSVLGTSSLWNGTAIFPFSTLVAGTHLLSASYYGDANNAASASSAVSLTVNQAVSTTTSLTVSPNPAAFGQPVTLTAKVVPSSATGTITFDDGTTVLGSGTLSSGTVTFTTSTLPAGTRSLIANYGGDSKDAPSASSAVALIVNQVSLGVSPNPSIFGLSMTLTATVIPASTTGTISFRDGANQIGTSNLANGTAAFSTSALAAGPHTLTAALGAITSNSVNEVVNKASSTTSFSALPASSIPGQTVNLTATVSPSSATGSVTFLDGQATLGIVTLNNGTAAFPATSLTAGGHSLTAAYGGDGNFSGSTSAAAAVAVGQGSTATTLAASANPAHAGDTLTLTAVVAPPSATGSVTFKDANATLGMGTLSNGTAIFATPTLTMGSHSLTAAYSGDSTNSQSTSAILTETIVQAAIATTTSLTASPSPVIVGQNVTLSAAVIPSSATGTITFKDGANTINTVAMAGGSASLVLSTLGPGSHSLTASYSGDSANSPSTSPIAVEVINPAGPWVTLTASSNPATLGQIVTLIATVYPSSATGTIAFKDSTNTLSTVPMAGGSATFAISTLTLGSHSLTASYSGDGANSPSTSPVLTEVVVQGATATTTSLTPSPNPANVGQAVTLVAAVVPSSATGTVTFKDSTTMLGTVAISSGSASLILPALTVGNHSLTASYSGDTADSPSTSLVAVEVINQGNPGVTLTATPNPAPLGQTVTLTATVSPASATGTVTFFNIVSASSVGGTVTVINGTATVTTTTLKQGTQLLQASYSGDTNNAASQSNFVTEVINPATTATTTTTTLSVSQATSTPGQAVTLTATVAPSAAAGSVTFTDGSTILGAAALSGGTATISTSSLATGSHTLTASYPGNASFAASTSNSVTETVGTGTGTACIAFPAGFVPFSSDANVSRPNSAGDLAAVGSMSAPNFATYQGLPLPAGPNQQFCGTVFLATGVPVVAYVPTGAERLGNFSPFAGLLTDPASGQPFPGGIIPSSRIPSTLAWRIAAALQNSTTTLSVTPVASTFRQFVTLTAIVTPLSATGPVTFLDGSTTLATATLVGGTAALTVATLASGTHSITASYGGDSNNGPSSSSPVTATVGPAQAPIVTRTVLTSSLTTSTFGQAVTLTAAVTPSTATGTMTFLDGSTTIGTATLGGGTATFKTSALAVGSHSLSASYGGDANDAPSTSATIAQTVSSGTPVLISSPITLPAAFAGTPYSQTFTATGGAAPFTWSLVSGTQELTMTASGNNGILSGTPKTAGAFTLTVRVQDGAGQANATVLTWAVNPPAPPISITVTAPATISDQPVPSVTLGAYPVALNGTFRLSFTPNAAGLPANFTNSAVQFVSGGITSPLAIPANSTTPVTLPAVQLGTVAGTITVQLTSLTIASTGQAVPLPTPAPSQTITVPRLAPVIVPGSVKITNITSSGFQVVLDASSTPRDLSGANLVFTAASGTQLSGTQTFTVSLTSVAGPWFDPANAAAVASGSAFTLTIPFIYSGDTSALGSVSVTLTNSVGTSTAVSGGT